MSTRRRSSNFLVSAVAVAAIIGGLWLAIDAAFGNLSAETVWTVVAYVALWVVASTIGFFLGRAPRN